MEFNFQEATRAPVRGTEIFLLYGPPKIGKTTFLCGVPRLFVICPEDGLAGIDQPAQHFPRQPRTLPEIHQAIDAFEAGNRAVADASRCRHVAIDSLSWVQDCINQAARGEVRSRNLGTDFQSGHKVVDAHWDTFWERIALLRRRAGVHVWLVSHGETRPEVTATGDTFPKWDLQLDKKAAATARRSVDHVLFIAQRAGVLKGGKGKRTIGTYGGRVIYTRDSPDHFAGSRSSVPEVVAATWADLTKALTSGEPAPEEKIRATIESALHRLGPIDRAAIETDLATAKTSRDLTTVLSRAQGMAAVLDEDEDEDPLEPDVEAFLVRLADPALTFDGLTAIRSELNANRPATGVDEIRRAVREALRRLAVAPVPAPAPKAPPVEPVDEQTAAIAATCGVILSVVRGVDMLASEGKTEEDIAQRTGVSVEKVREIAAALGYTPAAKPAAEAPAGQKARAR